MVSRMCWLLAVGLIPAMASAAPVPVPAEGKYEPPTFTAHTLPGDKVLADLKAYIKLFGGDEAVKKFEESVTGVLGKMASSAIDRSRPVCAYGYLRPEIEESFGFLVIPTASEKEALAALERMGLTAKAEPTGGRYKLSTEKAGLPLPIYAQFTDGGKLLYVSINAKPEILNKDQLIPVAKLVTPKATTHLTVTAYPERIPNSVRQILLELDRDLMDELNQLEQRKPRDMPASFPSFMKESLKLGKRTMGAIFTETETVTATGNLNTKNGNLEVELTVVPRAGTTFAKDVEALKAPTGRFHQLTTPDATLGGWGVLPTPLPKELRTHGGAFLTEWASILKEEFPKEFGELFKALGEQAGKAVTNGKVDLGFALTGPNKAGLFTAISAVAVDDSTGIEKAARAAVKGLPEEILKRVQLDALKVEGVAVHRVEIGELADPELQRVFGKDAKLLLAFGKDAVYAAAGPDAEAELKRAMTLKPTTATAFDVVLHGARAVKLLQPDRFNNEIIQVGKRLDGFTSYVGVDVTGGKELRIRGKSGALMFLLVAFSSARAEFQAVPPPIKK